LPPETIQRIEQAIATKPDGTLVDSLTQQLEQFMGGA
jgi:hypothetical protein